MLNEFLKVAYAQSTQRTEQEELVTLMKQLPMAELHKIARGEKVAYLGPCSDGGGNQSWVEQFKGTPFMEQAVGLEQELLQAEMASQQRNQVESQRSQQSYAQMDQIRMKKRLLELQKAKGEMGTLASAGVPVSGDLPGGQGPDQGEGAPAGTDMAGMPAKQAAARLRKHAFSVTSDGHKFDADMARLRERQAAEELELLHEHGVFERGSAVAKKPGYALSKPTDPGFHDLRHAAYTAEKHEKGENAYNPFGGMFTPSRYEDDSATDWVYGKPKTNGEYGPKHKKASAADSVGRLLARADMTKAAHQTELLTVGDRAGRILAKTAGLGGALLRVAEKNPGMVVGGAIGAIHGLTKQDGGIVDAVGEGLGGAALGHVVGGMGGHLMEGKSLGDAAKAYGHQVKREGQVLSGHMGGRSEKRVFDHVPAVQAPTPPAGA